MPARHENRSENRQRLMEIVEVVRRHEIIKGLTPEKLCAIIEELGPTFIKLGQILSMRSDILPKEYCEALKKLRSSVAPMPYEQVVSIVERSYGRPLGEVFSAFDEQALGSASIAQAHAAVLCSGESVVVKVQRDGIHDVMNRDIMLLKRACKMLEYTPASGLVNFNQVLDEMWVVAQEEMNFLTEATNLERFRALNADVAFVTSPILYREWTTTHVLGMERIDGVAIDDREALLAGGYDPAEIGAKLADNYVRQIMEDGFFHADPHPGNLRVRDGKIVWLDMGMMGTLTERERKLVGQAVSGVARGDVGLCRDAVLGLGEFRGKTDKRQLYRDIEGLLDQYGTADLGSMDLAKVFEDLTDVMKRNGISMPSSDDARARPCDHRGRRRRPQPGDQRDERRHRADGQPAPAQHRLARGNRPGRAGGLRQRAQVAGNPLADGRYSAHGAERRGQSGRRAPRRGRHGAPHAGCRFEALRRARRRRPARLRRAAARRHPAGGRPLVAHRLLFPPQRRPARVGVRVEGSEKITRRGASRAAYKRPCRFARHGRRFRVHPSAHIRPGSGAAPPARRRPEARSAAPSPAGRRIP